MTNNRVKFPAIYAEKIIYLSVSILQSVTTFTNDKKMFLATITALHVSVLYLLNAVPDEMKILLLKKYFFPFRIFEVVLE